MNRIREARLFPRLVAIIPIAGAILCAALVLAVVGASPLETMSNMVQGAFGSPEKIADVLVMAVPLILVSAGLLITFAAGLWNIGIEGQIAFGAIATTLLLRVLQSSDLPPQAIIIGALIAGMLGGALWSLLAGCLRVFGGVNEIFGGLGLNAVVMAFTVWLIFGPWKRPGVGSMSGTEPFSESLWLPQLGTLRISPIALGIALVVLVAVIWLLRATRLGLTLKAVGLNAKAASYLGVPSQTIVLIAFSLCGALAGMAGALQVSAVYHRLIPSISSGYGFLGIMVALLVQRRPMWLLPVVIVFAALSVGGIQLPVLMQLDSSLAGVLQGIVVVSVLALQGVRAREQGGA